MQSRSPALSAHRSPGGQVRNPRRARARQLGKREARAPGPHLLYLPGQPALPSSHPAAGRRPAAPHLAQHFAPAVALPRRGVDNNPRDLRSRVRVVMMVVWCRLGHLGLGLPVFRGLLRSLLLRVPAASFAQRLLAHLGASGGLVGDSPQEFHRGPATRFCLLPPPRHGHASGLALVLKSLVPKSLVPQPTDYSDIQLRLCERERAVNPFIPRLGWAGHRDVRKDAPPSGFGASALDRCGLAAWLRPGLEVAEREVTSVLCTP